MNYRIQVLTPTLVGDGQRLSPIDYMVWKDQVNVLDQRRIFRLLARGPRLEGYLTQLRKAEKLDFASWGGFAQNFAGRRIPFEHPGLTQIWQQTRAEFLHIPTFCSGPAGAYLPGSALKGVLRTGLVSQRCTPAVMHQLAERMNSDHAPRRLGEAVENMTMPQVRDPLRGYAFFDSHAVPVSAFKVFLTRIATLEQRTGKLEPGWKPVPWFVEMAAPGAEFTGDLRESPAEKAAAPERLLEAANRHAADLLAMQKLYAERSRLAEVEKSVSKLEAQLAEAKSARGALVNIGWGGGLLGKAAFLDTENADYRRILSALPYYSRAIRSGLPFPKTRKIVWLNNQPAAFPGWIRINL